MVLVSISLRLEFTVVGEPSRIFDNSPMSATLNFALSITSCFFERFLLVIIDLIVY
jgi:hypothetical protein